MSSDPARVLGLPGGRLSPGAPADLTILEIAGERTVDPARFLGRSRNTPFGGWTVTGGPWMTIVSGTPVWTNLQLDEVALPIVLAKLTGRTGPGTYAHVKDAADFIQGDQPV